ncbi:MAG: hypothetical protein CL920_34630 [Deltaproteobacteria bacterium]|nr:hypothetical protein [Deltaproteobacteria bacterium]MBU53861.1 hypothetical protein [Deltaproteobacteria bacterium]
MRKILGFCLIVLMTAGTLMGATCSKQIKCKFSRDCKGSMICGPRGYCINQCKSKEDCHQDQRCVEGSCKEL